jgi:hypothetical protein
MDGDGRCEGAEEQFLTDLYDQLKIEEQCPLAREWLPSRDKLHPAQPRFQEPSHWEVHGPRQSWWLTVVDPRYPGPEYPWRVRPHGDPAFFHAACGSPVLLGDAKRFIRVVLVTRMEEFDLGHANAETAYSQGASSADPPWVSTALP